MSKAILSDDFFDGFRSSILDVTSAETLPPECYTDESFYQFEKEALFNHEWLCVGRESWVANPGDFFTSMHCGEPIVVTRTADGELIAMSSVCRHRAMLFAEGHGNARTLLCPYHHWSYSLDGQLIGAPAMNLTKDFDRTAIKLPRFKVEVWLGFVFINFDPDAPPLGPRLEAVTAVLGNYDTANTEGPFPDPASRYPWNWKVMLENNNDGYHANRLHRGPLHDFIPSDRASFPELPADTAGYFRYNGTTHPDAGFNAMQKAVLKIFPKLTDEDRNRVLFANIPPTLSLVFTSDMIIYLILMAESAAYHSMQIGFLFAPGAMKDPLFDERFGMSVRAAMTITAQDLHVDALVQTGLNSRFAPRGRYSWQEQAQQQLNLWLVPRYLAAWNRMRSGTNGHSASPTP